MTEPSVTPTPEVIDIPSAGQPAQNGNNKRLVWIIVAIVIVLLLMCCCCVLAPLGLLAANGQGFEKNFEWDLSTWLPMVVQWI